MEKDERGKRTKEHAETERRTSEMDEIRRRSEEAQAVMAMTERAGLYTLTLDRLGKLGKTRNGIIRFPDVFEKLCSSHQMTKDQCWDVLFLLAEFDIIKIIPGHGIKIMEN